MLPPSDNCISAGHLAFGENVVFKVGTTVNRKRPRAKGKDRKTEAQQNRTFEAAAAAAVCGTVRIA